MFAFMLDISFTNEIVRAKSDGGKKKIEPISVFQAPVTWKIFKV